jgi:hypothetical protein
MKNMTNVDANSTAPYWDRAQRRKQQSGFSLMELTIALGVFLVIGGAAMSLVRAHVPLVSTQQTQVGMNMNLRTALAQMEVDVANAGMGYYTTTNIPSWPVGVTISNSQPGTGCNTATTSPAGSTFGANCFDTLNVISADPAIPPLHPSASATTAADVDTSAVNTVYLTTPATFASATAFAASFHTGDELLWLQPQLGGPSSMTTTTLTADGAVSSTPNVIMLTFNKTTAANPPTTYGGVNGTDPLNIANPQDDSTTSTTLNTNSTVSVLTAGPFHAATDWVLRLDPITYKVDTSTPTNPKLIRQHGLNATATVDVIAEQIVGFKVGAALRQPLPTDPPFWFDTNGYGQNWSQICALRISILARTTPNSNLASNFKNSFDQGPYQIVGSSITINPRNLSMTSQ